MEQALLRQRGQPYRLRQVSSSQPPHRRLSLSLFSPSLAFVLLQVPELSARKSLVFLQQQPCHYLVSYPSFSKAQLFAQAWVHYPDRMESGKRVVWWHPLSAELQAVLEYGRNSASVTGGCNTGRVEALPRVGVS